MIFIQKNKYIRDGRAPEPVKESTSRVMSANKAKNTKPELLLRKTLWSMGVRGYRLHPKVVPGRPDITFNQRRIAIFVNGCFWHQCPYCKPSNPKTHISFWNQKFKKNVERDIQKMYLLHKSKWKVIVVWECQLKNNPENLIKSILNTIG